MGHAHSHESQTTYYVEQIFTIAVCGAIGGVCVLLYMRKEDLSGMLSGNQHSRVLFGGIGLLCLVLIRAVYVWIAAGKTRTTASNHTHEHNHGHDHDHAHCDHDHAHPDHALPQLNPAVAATVHGEHDHAHHDHAHCDHDHEHEEEQKSLTMAGDHEHFHDHHGHDHGWAPWRYALLILPVVLFLLGLPAKGGMNVSNVSGLEVDSSSIGQTSDKGQNFTIGFNQLEQAARNADRREDLAGTTVRLKGQYKGDCLDQFTLVRYKINCCAADAIPLKAVIMIDPKMAGKVKVDPDAFRNKWVQITGRLEFSPTGKGEVIPVILLEPKDQNDLVTVIVKEVPPDTDPYARD